MPMDNILTSQPHMDLEVDMVGLVRDAFGIVDQIVQQVAHNNNITQ
jgi:hypothetical protein